MATGYGLTLLPVKIVSLVVGMCSLLLAWHLARSSRRDPAPATGYGGTGADPDFEAGVPPLHETDHALDATPKAPYVGAEVETEPAASEPTVDEPELAPEAPELAPEAPEASPAEAAPSTALPFSLTEPPSPPEKSEPAPKPEEAPATKPAPTRQSPASTPPPRAASPDKIKIVLEATSMQQGLPPRHHKIRVGLGSQGRRRA